MLNLIFLGAPGAGKGTQADFVSQKFNIPQISTGVMLRQEMANATPLGIKIKAAMNSGALVADSDVTELVRARIMMDDCRNGFILDGFPRNIAQAEELDALLTELGRKITSVIEIRVDDDVIAERMSGRRTCRNCGATYHLLYNKPETAGKCDKCGAELTVRADDDVCVVYERLRIYHEQTAPLNDYYRSRGLLCTVDGQEDVMHTHALVLKAIEA